MELVRVRGVKENVIVMSVRDIDTVRAHVMFVIGSFMLSIKLV